jgi:hypothetical protein
MARLIFWVFLLLWRAGPPVASWVQTEVFGRVPAAPFLELMPARTALGRSLTMASLLVGVLGLAFFASLAAGTWVLAVALLLVGVLAIGFSRAIGSFWWPAALAGAFVGLALFLAILANLSPWTSAADLESQQAIVLAAGGLIMVVLALWSSTVTVLALQKLETLRRRP